MFAVTACVQAPKKPQSGDYGESRGQVKMPPKRPSINLDQLQTTLRMNREADELGFQNRWFDTCKIGQDLSSKCRGKRFTVIHFRLLCRNSTGTVELVSRDELSPLSTSSIKWILGPRSGSIPIDDEGYGQVRLVTPGSVRNQRFVLKLGTHSLGVRAKSVKQIVLPGDWCSL